jgi:arylsulfatase A-like enzyme
MSRRWLTALTAVYLFAGFARAADRPNFVLMMTDDQRWDALSCEGNKILQTPNMDRIASEGIRFRNMFVTNSLCSPSRATFLTGLYSHTHGVIDNRAKKLKGDQPILSDLLREVGYQVAFCGKSHIGGFLRDRTWDYYFGYKGQGRYLNPKIAEGTDGEDVEHPGYMDDVVTTKAIDWLKSKKDDRPFCLFLWFKAPHRPWIRARRHLDLYRDVAIPKPDTFDDDLKGYPGKPRAFAVADNKIGDFGDVRTLDGFVKDYYASIYAVDENIGRVFETLKQTGELDDTVMLHTGDNGFFLGEWRAFDKRLIHEPSIRVPLLIRYPKLIKPGSLSDKMVLNIDLAPTILDLAGAKVPRWMHGRSAVPLLKGEEDGWRKDWLYEYFEYPGAHSVRRHYGVRTDRYKYIHYPAYKDKERDEPEEFELYDLQKDPGEKNNLHGRPGYEEIAKKLKARLVELRKETGDL